MPATVRDIDGNDTDNPQLVSEYINEIYVYLRRLERMQSVRKDYMEGISPYSLTWLYHGCYHSVVLNTLRIHHIRMTRSNLRMPWSWWLKLGTSPISYFRLSDHTQNEKDLNRLAGAGSSEVSFITGDFVPHHSHHRQIPSGSMRLGDVCDCWTVQYI